MIARSFDTELATRWASHHRSNCENSADKEEIHTRRQPTKQIITQVAEYFHVDKKELQTEFLSDQIAYKILDEEADIEILKVAEEKVKYLKTVKNGK